MARAYYGDDPTALRESRTHLVREAAILRDEYWGSKGRTARHLAGRDDV